mgnify:CR=1 FL=1
MVWEEILIGFTVAGFMKVFVPEAFWKALFLQGYQDTLPELAGSGVTFAGVMAFIYSDLMVPPLVRVNAKYYG